MDGRRNGGRGREEGREKGTNGLSLSEESGRSRSGGWGGRGGGGGLRDSDVGEVRHS